MIQSQTSQPANVIRVGVVTNCWNEYGLIIESAVSRAAQHLGLEMIVEPMHPRNANS